MRLSRSVAVALAAFALLAQAADAKPRMTTHTVIQGDDASVLGYGCEPATYSVAYRGLARDLESYRPVEGSRLAGPDAYVGDGPRYWLNVVHVEEGDGRITWTVEPDAADCARYGDAWEWRLPEREWSVEYERGVYAIVGRSQSAYRWRTDAGVVNIAGLPVSRLFGGRLSLRHVAGYLGRPRRVTGGGPRNAVCNARWPKLGLRASFASFGLEPDCWKRQLQSARISGPAVRKWAAVEGYKPGLLGGTLPPHGHRDDLGYKWWPYGESSIDPMITPRYDGDPRRITAFDLWIGAAGD